MSDSETTLVDQNTAGKNPDGAVPIDRFDGYLDGWLPGVDKPKGFGNPFILKENGGDYTLEESVALCERLFEKVIQWSDEFRAAVEDLEGETLACWCIETKDACHGEIYLDYLNDGEDEDRGHTHDEICETLGCKNAPAEDGLCRECLDISPEGEDEDEERNHTEQNDSGDEYDAVPDALRETDQWVCWEYDERTDADGEPYKTKMPVNADTGGSAKSNKPDTWVSFDLACEHERQNEDIAGIGFMFSEDGPFAGVDFDNVIDDGPMGGWESWAREDIRELDSYTEFSPSKTGAHTIVKAEKPGDSCRTRMEQTLDAYEKSEIEIYDGSSGRYFTVTGDHIDGTPETINERADEFASVYRDAFESDGSGGADSATTVDAATAEEIADDALEALEAGKTSAGASGDGGTNPDLSDEEIIEKAKAASNGDEFKLLWKGDWQECEKDFDSHSEARMSLLCHLAFWVGEDSQQIDDIYQKSDLHSQRADKWPRVRDDENEIQKAIRETSKVYTVSSGGDDVEDEVREYREEFSGVDYRSARRSLTSMLDELESREYDKEEFITEAFTREFADAIANGGKLSRAANAVSDHCSYKISDAKDDMTEWAENEIKGGDEDIHRTPIDVRIDNAEEIKIRRTTDHVPDAEVIFDFGNGDRVPFEMRNEQGRRGFCSAEVFRDEMFDAGMSYPDKPTEDRRDARDWKDYIMDVVEGYGPVDVTEIEERGDRTKAVDALRNEIESSAGFGDLNHVTGGGNRVYWNRGAGEVWILNPVPKNIAEDRDVSTAGLQAELDARSCTVERKDGAVSERGTVTNGKRLTFWVLNDAKMEPGAFAEDPNDIETSAVEKTNSILSDTADTGVLAEVMSDGGNDVTTGDEADE